MRDLMLRMTGNAKWARRLPIGEVYPAPEEKANTCSYK